MRRAYFVLFTLLVACSFDWDAFVPAPATSNGGGPSSGGAGPGGSIGGMSAVGGAGGEGGLGPTYVEAVMQSSPVAYWRLGETTAAVARDAVGNNDAPYSGSLDLAQAGAIIGDPDSAMFSPGIDGYVEVGDVFDFEGGAAFSVELWIKPQLPAQMFTRVITKRAGSMGTAQGWDIHIAAPDNVRFEVLRDGSGSSVGSRISLDEWHHVVAIFKPPDLTMYVDGAEVDTANTPIALFGHDLPLYFGRNAGGQLYAGATDEIAIYDRELAGTEIADHYAASGR